MQISNGVLGHVFWLFGLSGAGKSTLAERLSNELRSRGVPVLSLDGDVLRSGLCTGLGFADADRTENIRRAAETAKLGVHSRLCVVASFITPLEVQRQLVTSVLGMDGVSLIYVSTPLEICRTRDVKGLYAGASNGVVPRMTGVASIFEPPMRVDFDLRASGEPVDSSAAGLVSFALGRIALH